MSNVSQWDVSAPNNNAAPPDGAPEGMAANTVNDTMREMMAATARWYQDINGSLVTGGAGNAYTLTTNNNNSSLTDLPLVVFVANRANSGAATLNVDGLGAKSLRFGGVALAAGVIQEGVAYIAIYNAEDDAFDIVGYPTKDASEITTGELDDDRLSDNVPLKDAPNTFTSAQTISTTLIWQYFRDSDAGENEKLSRLQAGGPGIIWATRTDEDGTGETFFQVTRNGVEVTEIELNADVLDFNGNADISGTLAVGGAATFTAGIPIIARSGAPRFVSFVDGQAEDQGGWLYGGSAQGGNFRFFIATTADSAPSTAVNEAFVIRRNGTTVTEVELNATDLDFNGDLDVSGAVRAGTAATSTSATLAAGQIHHRSANTTVPSMNAGQWVAVQNTGTSSITLSEGSGVTLELGGTTTTGNRTLLAKGFAFIYFRANGVGVVHGNGVV